MVCKCSLSKFSVPSDSDILHKKKAKEELDKSDTINQFWKIKTELDKITNLGNVKGPKKIDTAWQQRNSRFLK